MGTLQRLLSRTAAFVTLTLAASVSSQTLPVIVDATGNEPHAWWLADAPQSAGALDDLLFAMGATFVSPESSQPDAAPSSLLRRIDITANNARNLAGLYGAERVAVGRLERTGAESQPWLGLTRVGLRLTGELIDVGTGATIAPLDLAAAAYDVDPDRASDSATRAIAARLLALVPTARRGELVPPPSGPLTVVVRSGEGAAPYVAFRGVLRDAHPGIVEVMEAWAVEGEVALDVRLDDDADIASVRTAITRLGGTDAAEVRVVSVEARDDVLVVTVEPAPPPPVVPTM